MEAEGGVNRRQGGMSMLYHEVQESKLCAVHCVNTVLQGPFFSEFDLAALASDLDLQERQMMMTSQHHQPPLSSSSSGDFLSAASHNVSLDGDFSIQVLQKALEVWDLEVVPFNSPVAEAAQIDPENENAFICHLHNHWFCIRKVDGEWYNFNSLLPAPQHLSKFYLVAYLDSLKNSGWSIFLVRGNFPKESPISSFEAANGFGQWLSCEDAERLMESSNNPVQGNLGPNAGQQLLDPSREMSLGIEDDESLMKQIEDEDLRAAIAASLMDSSQANASSEGKAAAVTQIGSEDSKNKIPTSAGTQSDSGIPNDNEDGSDKILPAAGPRNDSEAGTGDTPADNHQNDHKVGSEDIPPSAGIQGDPEGGKEQNKTAS